jgi:hypothetical protein
MKWAYYVQYKLRAAVILFVILCGVMINHFWERSNFSRLDESVSSIYKDRLLPATYLFQLSDHLYKKRLLQNQAHINMAEQQQHDEAMALLIKNYESTYLTDAEKAQWLMFKQHLAAYNNSGENAASQQLAQADFDQALSDLNLLNNTQAQEGDQLQKTSKGILTSGAFSSQIEIVLIIGLGLFTVMLLSVTDSKLFKQSAEKFQLN